MKNHISNSSGAFGSRQAPETQKLVDDILDNMPAEGVDPLDDMEGLINNDTDSQPKGAPCQACPGSCNTMGTVILILAAIGAYTVLDRIFGKH